MFFLNKIHTKFIIASSLILAVTLAAFTLISASYFSKTVTQITDAELARDLECEKAENIENTLGNEFGHTESEFGHIEGTSEEIPHDESAEMLAAESKNCHLDTATRIEEEKKIISEALLELEMTAAWMALIAIFLSSGVIYLISRHITKPLIALKKAANEVGSGNLDAEIKIESSDEIGELAKEFKLMVGEVKKSYLNLQREQAQLLASVNSLSLGFMLLDVQGKAIITNRSIRAMFNDENLTLKDITDRLNTIIDLPDYHRTILERKDDYLTQDIAFEDKFLKIYISPVILKKPDEEIIGSVILIEDITQQKRLEDSKNSFIEITAHELRTPLSIIKGNTELLLETTSTKLTKQQINSLLEATEKNSIRLLRIVNEFLDLTVLEENKLQFNTKFFDISNLINDIVSELKPKAEEKGLYINTSAPDKSLPEIIADPDKSRQVLINILVNSLQYTEKGGVTISLEQSDNFVKISVRDTGIGIETNDQKMLFQKFHTVRKQFLHSKEYGSGIGLYVSKLLLESMGGKIRLEKSDPKTGTTFAIFFPTKSHELKSKNLSSNTNNK